MNESNTNPTSTEPSLALPKHKQPLTGRKLTRHIQILRTKEAGSLKLIEETTRQLLLLTVDAPLATAALILLTGKQKDREIIRLRRELLSERNHRERFQRSILPRLRSKADECRKLRDQIDGLTEKHKIERKRLKAQAKQKVTS